MHSAEIQAKILGFQKLELTECLIYERLATFTKDPKNADVLKRLARDERRHYEVWRSHSGRDVAVDWIKIWIHVLSAKVFGLTFAIKLTEKVESHAESAYLSVADQVPEARAMAKEEGGHEDALVAMIDEESLKYTGSMVLGLNDALVELTGVLAGLTFALANAKLIAAVGLITGIAASMAMAASEFLSTKAENDGRDPVKAAAYTGFAYIGTVFFLVAPYFIFHTLILSLAMTMVNAVIVIAIFTFYASVTQDVSFRKRFLEMVTISFGVAAVSFMMGIGVKHWLGVDV